MRRLVVIVCGALALVLIVMSQPAKARSERSERPGRAAQTGQAELRRLMRRLTEQDGAIGAQALVTAARRRTAIAEGRGDLRTGTPMPSGGRFRAGSLTKPFVATVVLQLVGEGKVALDAPVDRYLPGVVRGNGNDGRQITVRHLLQQTSGLPDYLRYLTPQELIETRFHHREPLDLLAVALAHGRLFEPGKEWGYSNTNYLLAALLIERVTGRTHGQEIARRIARPLGLRDTYVPSGTFIAGLHPRGYVKPGAEPEAEPLDVTELDPSMAFGSGDLISSAKDVNRFLGALVTGRLLRPAQLKEMMTTRPTGVSPGDAYGLGLRRSSLDGCTGEFWGHGGDMLGFSTRSGVTADGRRRVTVMTTLNPGGTQAQKDDQQLAVSAAL